MEDLVQRLNETKAARKEELVNLSMNTLATLCTASGVLGFGELAYYSSETKEVYQAVIQTLGAFGLAAFTLLYFDFVVDNVREIVDLSQKINVHTYNLSRQ